MDLLDPWLLFLEACVLCNYLSRLFFRFFLRFLELHETKCRLRDLIVCGVEIIGGYLWLRSYKEYMFLLSLSFSVSSCVLIVNLSLFVVLVCLITCLKNGW